MAVASAPVIRDRSALIAPRLKIGGWRAGPPGVRIAAMPGLPYPVKAALTRGRSTAWLARTGGRPDDSGLRILLYHRVADDRDPLAIAPARFREQMGFLASAGYRVTDLMDALTLLDRDTMPART